MNTARYNKGDLKSAQALLESAENRVFAPQYYLGKAELHTLLSKAYTVIAEEDGALYGLASMDKSGNLGLLYVSGENFKRTAKLLVRALERLAGKKGVAKISVVPSEDTVKIFKECGYLKADAGKNLEESNELYYKVIEKEKPPVDFPPERVKRFTLDRRKPIKIEGKVSAFPAIFFGIACFFIILLTILGIAAKNGSANVYGAENIPMFAVVFGMLFAAALAIFIAYNVRGVRLKKQVLSMTVTNAVVTGVTSDTYWAHDSDGERERYVRLFLYYSYYDEDMQLREGRFESKYKNRAPYFYEGQELVVACSGELNYILRKYTLLSGDGGTEEAEVNKSVPEKPKRVSNPLAYAPIAERRIYYIISAVVFGMLAVTVGAVCFFEYLAAVQTSGTFWNEIKFALPFIAFAVVTLGGIAAFYLALPLAARAKYKRILKTDAKFAAGRLLCADKTYRDGNKNAFYCEYTTDGGEKKRVRIMAIHVADRVKHGRTEVTVAYNGATEVVLDKKR